MTSLIHILQLLSSIFLFQTQIDLHTQAKNADLTNQPFTKTVRSGNSVPATCSVPELFFLIGATPGQNLYGCTSTNNFTLLTGGGGGVPPYVTSIGSPGQTSISIATSTHGQGSYPIVFAYDSSGNSATLNVANSGCPSACTGNLTLTSLNPFIGVITVIGSVGGSGAPISIGQSVGGATDNTLLATNNSGNLVSTNQIILSSQSGISLQSAINTLGSLGGGSIILACDGTYSLAGTAIYIQYSNITINGQGCAKIHQTVNNIDAIDVGWTGSAFAQVHDIRITGIQITGSADGSGTNVTVGVNCLNPASYSKGVSGSYNIRVDHILESGFTMGILATGVTNFYAANNIMGGNYYVAGLSAGGYSIITQTCYGAEITKNIITATSTDRHAIYESVDQSKSGDKRGSDINIEGNVIDWVATNGPTYFESPIVLRAAQRLNVQNNITRNNFSGINSVISDGNATDYNISNNTIVQVNGHSTTQYELIALTDGSSGTNHYTGIVVNNNKGTSPNDYTYGMNGSQLQNFTINGNSFTVSGSHAVGIQLTGSTAGHITGNTLVGSGSLYAIYEDSSSSNIVIGPETISGFNTRWSINTSGTFFLFPRYARLDANGSGGYTITQDLDSIISSFTSDTNGAAITFTTNVDPTYLQNDSIVMGIDSSPHYFYNRAATGQVLTLGIVNPATSSPQPIASVANRFIIELLQ